MLTIQCLILGIFKTKIIVKKLFLTDFLLTLHCELDKVTRAFYCKKSLAKCELSQQSWRAIFTKTQCDAIFSILPRFSCGITRGYNLVKLTVYIVVAWLITSLFDDKIWKIFAYDIKKNILFVYLFQINLFILTKISLKINMPVDKSVIYLYPQAEKNGQRPTRRPGLYWGFYLLIFFVEMKKSWKMKKRFNVVDCINVCVFILAYKQNCNFFCIL